jgi:DNA-binding NarL/FixJ family response regulator
MTTTLLLSDPRRVVREAMAEFLAGEAGHCVTAVAVDPSSIVLQVQRTGASVVVISGCVPDTLLQQVCHSLRELEPRPRVLVIDGDPEQSALLRAIEDGVDGYLTGESGLAEVVKAIASVAVGDSVVPPSMLGPLLRGLIDRQREEERALEKLDRLTPREREVLTLVAEGLDDHRIAERLTISPETARTHVHRILRKLEVRSRIDAIALVAPTGVADRLGRLLEGSSR